MKSLSTLAMLAGLMMFAVGCGETATTDAPPAEDTGAATEEMHEDHDHAEGDMDADGTVEVEEEVVEETPTEQ